MNICKLILHYNTPKETTYLYHLIPGSFIVDNGSGDPFKGMRVIRFADNLGFVKNWNRVIRMVMREKQYDAFWLFNSDVVILPEAIERIQYLMDAGDIQMITPSYNCWMKQCQNQGTGDVREIKCMELTAPVIRRDVFEQIGMFAPEFNLGSGVDFDFAFRCQKAGIKLWCDDGSTFNHLEHVSIKAGGDLKKYSAMASHEMNVGMARKYGVNWKKYVQDKLEINKKTTNKRNMRKIAVYTTIFGGYDNLIPVPPQSMQADFFCITDDKSLKAVEPWKIIHVTSPRRDMHPRMRAKWYKIYPWEAAELNGYDATIFIDGCVQVLSPDFVSFCTSNLKTDIAVFKHPERNCIYDEVRASEIMVKYQDEPIHDQLKYYSRWWPKNAGLYACTVIVRKHTDRIRHLMMSWFHENIKFSWQDQLSFPVVCKVHHITPDILPGNLYQNQYFKRIHHADKEDQALVKSPVDVPASRNMVIQYIIDTLGYERYLEIGLRNGDTFNNIKCKKKESVDPVVTGDHVPTHRMTSDEFFATVAKKRKGKFDMIFIDGDHHYEQVKKDLDNALENIQPKGCVVLHDTNPINKRFTEFDRCGDAFKVLVDLYCDYDGVIYNTITIPDDEGNGITVVFKTSKKSWTNKSLEKEKLYDYDEFDKKRQQIALITEWKYFRGIIDGMKPVRK